MVVEHPVQDLLPCCYNIIFIISIYIIINGVQFVQKGMLEQV